jgi:hypothetical protein
MFEKPMEPSRNDTSILLLTSVIICLYLVHIVESGFKHHNQG